MKEKVLTKEALITCAHVGFLKEEKNEMESMNIPNPHHRRDGLWICTPYLQGVLQAPINESVTNWAVGIEEAKTQKENISALWI